MELHGFLSIDKPLGWTSHDVVARLRRILGIRRVGHAGTLDPAATGVLITGAGRATRFLDFVQAEKKEYVAHVVLGVISDSADIDGTFEEQRDQGNAPAIELVRQVLSQFSGDIEQVPPKFSAIKQGGVPLYKRARRGEAVDVPKRLVTITRLDLIAYDFPDLTVRVECSSGTYIRSLARDIGDELGTGAYLHHLIRTRVGAFELNTCWSLSHLDQMKFPETWANVAVSTDLVFDSDPAVWLSEHATDAWYHGRSVRVDESPSAPVEAARAYDDLGAFAGIGYVDASQNAPSIVRPRIVLAT